MNENPSLCFHPKERTKVRTVIRIIFGTKRKIQEVGGNYESRNVM
jgi:hypothetical protein